MLFYVVCPRYVALQIRILFVEMVDQTGFEPATPCVQSRCSPN